MAFSSALCLCFLFAAAATVPAAPAGLTGEAVAERILLLLHRVASTEHASVTRAAEHASRLVRDLVFASSGLAMLQNTTAEDEPDEWKAVSAYNLLHQRMAELDKGAEHVTNKVEWSLAPLNLATIQHTMDAAHEALMAVLKAPVDQEEQEKEHFVQMFEKVYSPALWRLYDALVDAEGLGAHNMANSTRVLLKNDALAISVCYDVFFRQLVRGIAIEAAYDAFQRLSDPDSDAQLWLDRFEPIFAMAKLLDQAIRDSWATQYPSMAEQFLMEHRHLPNTVVATQLQSYLSALYGQRLWFVLVFAGEEGVTKRHRFDTCGGWSKFDADSRTVVAVQSLPNNVGGPKVPPNYHFFGVKTSRWGFYLPFEKIASKIFDRIGYSCQTYSLQAVVESQADPALSGPARHIARKEVLIKRYFASNKLFTLLAVV